MKHGIFFSNKRRIPELNGADDVPKRNISIKTMVNNEKKKSKLQNENKTSVTQQIAFLT